MNALLSVITAALISVGAASASIQVPASTGCEVPGCVLEERHVHAQVAPVVCGVAGCQQTSQHSHAACGVYDCLQDGQHSHASCGVEVCGIIGSHDHNGSTRGSVAHEGKYAASAPYCDTPGTGAAGANAPAAPASAASAASAAGASSAGHGSNSAAGHSSGHGSGHH